MGQGRAADGHQSGLNDLVGLDVRCFDDRRPAGNIVFYLGGEGLRAASGLIWNLAAKFEKTLMRVGVVERLVEGISESVEYGARCPLRSKQGPPRRCIEVRKSNLNRCRDIRQRGMTFAGPDGIYFDQAGWINLPNVQNRTHEIIDLAAEQCRHGRRIAGEGYEGWFDDQCCIEDQRIGE